MSALYEWTSRLLFPTGAGGPCDPPPPAEAKSYCSPCCTPPPGFPGGGVLLGQGWVEDLERGPRGDPFPPH